MPPPEQEHFGQESVEHSQGFTPMPDPTPAEPSDIGGSHDSLRNEADKLSESRRETPQEVQEVGYQRGGQPVDPKETVSRDKAARDIAAFRERREKQEEQEAIEAIRRDTDNLRSGRVDQQQPQQFSPEQQHAQTQLNNAYQSPTHSQPGELSPYDQQLVNGAKDQQVRQNVKQTFNAIGQRMAELDAQIGERYASGLDTKALGDEWFQLSQQLDDIGFVDRAQMMMEQGLSPRVATAVADREVLEWIQKATEPYEEAYRANVQKHESNCMELIGALEYAIGFMFPELAGAKDVKAVISAVRQRNPERADDLARGYAQFESAVEMGLQARQRNEVETRERFATWSKNEDNAFRAKHTEFMSPDVQKRIAFEAFEYLAEKGIPQDQVIRLHDSDQLFRSAVGQEILWEAMQFRRAEKLKQGVQSKRAPTAPARAIIRPGSSEDRIDSDRSERLPAEINGARAAAAILERRRARR